MNKPTNAVKIAYYEVQITRYEKDQLDREPNKDYVAGYLMGRMRVQWEIRKEEQA